VTTSSVPTFARALGLRVRQEREAHGWTQKQLAELACLAPRTVRAIENGEYGPSAFTLVAICGALGCTVDEVTASILPLKRQGQLQRNSVETI